MPRKRDPISRAPSPEDGVRDNFTVEEERCLREAGVGGETPWCPRCLGALELTPIGPKREVA